MTSDDAGLLLCCPAQDPGSGIVFWTVAKCTAPNVVLLAVANCTALVELESYLERKL